MLSITSYHIKLPAQVLTDNGGAHLLRDVTINGLEDGKTENTQNIKTLSLAYLIRS